MSWFRFRERESCGGTQGQRSELWRFLAWRAGDEQATKLTRWIDLYCRFTGLNPRSLR